MSESAGGGLGYHPALDGLRAISVIAVVLYHAGFGWMTGGFFGVEVFFVISGFLITSLLLDERVASGSTGLGRFWGRRARRLLPAAAVMLTVTALWGLTFGSPEQAAQLKRDLPWAVFYVANWGQILGDVPYFATGEPPLLRHLWSLAVEEQWYIVWPLVFVALCAVGWTSRHTAMMLLGAAAAVNVGILVVAHTGGATIDTSGPLDGADRINVLYLSTPSRASGLLIGAGLAFLWRTWRHTPRRSTPWALDAAAIVALFGLVVLFAVGEVTSDATYPWSMLAVSLLSAGLLVVAVHPAATWTRRSLGSAPMAAVGRRSYGLYLWHWPVFVIVGATVGSWTRFGVGLVIAVVASELCYRFVETPIRRGVIGRAWSSRRRRVVASGAIVGVGCGALVLAFSQVSAFDAAVGEQQASFELVPRDLVTNAAADTSAPVVPAPVSTAPPTTARSASVPVEPGHPSTTTPATTSTSTTTTTTTLPVLPRSVALVGDSQAHSLAVNLPSGVGDFFTFVDGSVDGCSVHESGTVITARPGFSSDFARCSGWPERWGRAARNGDVTLVMLGAWDVFDLEFDGQPVAFATPEWDRRFVEGVEAGVDAISFAGSHAALLEVACMRPVEARGAGVPPLPERADDQRVAHVNELLKGLAAGDPERITFIEGPDQWCADDPVATDRDYRWDGVHVYQRGANLILETIAPALLAIPIAAPEAEVTDG